MTRSRALAPRRASRPPTYLEVLENPLPSTVGAFLFLGAVAATIGLTFAYGSSLGKKLAA